MLGQKGTYKKNPQSDMASLAGTAYIALPNFIFFFGFLKQPVAIFLTFFVGYSLYQIYKISHCHIQYTSHVFALTALAALWCVFGGAGHFTYANIDWLIRDAVYGDLIYSPWPIAYQIHDSHSMILRSAIGYFLFPAGISSLVGIRFANLLLYAWTVIGAAIFLNLLPIKTKKIGTAILLAMLVIMFSGMDILGVLIATGEWPIFPLRLEWWTSFSYTSISGQLFWAPNHCLPIWIGSALFFRHLEQPDFLRLGTVFLPLTIIWTPFALPALAPFFLLHFIKMRNSQKFLWPTSIQLIGGISLGLAASIFLTLSTGEIPLKSGISHAGGQESFIRDYLVFTLAEFGILALVLGRRIKQHREIFLLATFILLALPFTFFGPSNDLLLRVSTPPLIFIAIICMLDIQQYISPSEGREKAQTPWGVIVILCIGAWTPFTEIWRATTWRHWQPDYKHSLVDKNNGGMPGHYIGKLSSSSPASWLLKSPNPVAESDKR